jgi:hypothetical protein
MAVGAAAAGARLALGSALRYCRRHVMVTAEIDSRDDAYRWVGKLRAAAAFFLKHVCSICLQMLLFGSQKLPATAAWQTIRVYL